MAGYDRHHIVERSTARLSGFSEDMINDPNNIVLIPRMRHWLINRWYADRMMITEAKALALSLWQDLGWSRDARA
ncbi:hypothetical protein RHIZ404_201030 [Rhizobium sp. EC-SD404]|nr:hypothetical protein RHIZ404_201030 [Rhizobium sp. EC-SD404]